MRKFTQKDVFLQSAAMLDTFTVGAEITACLRLSGTLYHKLYTFMAPLGSAQNTCLQLCLGSEKETASYSAGAYSKKSLALNFMR